MVALIQFLKRQIWYLKLREFEPLRLGLWLPFSGFVVLLVFLLRRWVLIRFADLHVISMGVPIYVTERYLSERELGFQEPCVPCIDVFFYSKKNISNIFLVNKLTALLPCVFGHGFRFFASIDWILKKYPRLSMHRIDFDNLDGDPANSLDRTEVHFKWEAQELEEGDRFLAELGIPVTAKIVCLLVRDNAYFSEFKKGYDDSGNNYRCSDIDNYILAAEELAGLGYFVFRMGAKMEKPFKTKNSKIIDYAFLESRTELLDVYLGFRAEFCITTGAGWDAVASHLFRKPILFTNLVPLSCLHTYRYKYLLTTKKHFDPNLNRVLTLTETAKLGFFNGFVAEQNKNKKIRFIENSPEEILGATMEMVERLNRTWKSSAEDEELQRRFWSLYPTNTISPFSGKPMHGEIRAQFSSYFLRNNPDWLQ